MIDEILINSDFIFDFSNRGKAQEAVTGKTLSFRSSLFHCSPAVTVTFLTVPVKPLLSSVVRYRERIDVKLTWMLNHVKTVQMIMPHAKAV